MSKEKTQLERLNTQKEYAKELIANEAVSREEALKLLSCSTRALTAFMSENQLKWIRKPHNGANQYSLNPLKKILHKRESIAQDSKENESQGLTFNSEANLLNSIGIYKIVSSSGGLYIGKASWSFRKRFNEHKNMLKKNKHHSMGLQRSYDKRPEAYFEIIETLNHSSYEKIAQRELYWWSYYSKGNYKIYNGKPTVDSKGLHHTQETKNKIAQAKVKVFTLEEVALIQDLYVNQKISKHAIARKILHISDKRLTQLIIDEQW